MKLNIILVICMAAFALAEDKYDSSDDDIDLSEVLGNDRLIMSYSKCLVNKGPCTPEVKKLKDQNMVSKAFILSTMVISLATAEFYSSRYDDFDIQPLLENDRILLGYTKCFLDQGPCTAEAKDFKKAIPEAVETTCGKCTPKQKQLIRKVIRAIMDKHPKAWEQLVEKYDENKTYRKTFNIFIEEND